MKCILTEFIVLILIHKYKHIYLQKYPRKTFVFKQHIVDFYFKVRDIDNIGLIRLNCDLPHRPFIGLTVIDRHHLKFVNKFCKCYVCNVKNCAQFAFELDVKFKSQLKIDGYAYS